MMLLGVALFTLRPYRPINKRVNLINYDFFYPYVLSVKQSKTLITNNTITL